MGHTVRKTLIVITTLILLTATVIFAFRSKSEGDNATKKFTDVKVFAPMFGVQGRTESGSLWLAYTAHWNDSNENDYEQIKVLMK